MSRFRVAGQKIATLGAGVAIKKGLDYGFDYGLYPLALIWFGYLWGGIIMTAASVVLNLAVIRAYDWSKQDWLMLETLKELKSTAEGSGNGLVAWMLRKGDAAAFVLLSWLEDSIVVTLYLRQGIRTYDGLSRRDWSIFWGSTVLSNLFWIGSLGVLMETLKAIFGPFF